MEAPAGGAVGDRVAVVKLHVLLGAGLEPRRGRFLEVLVVLAHEGRAVGEPERVVRPAVVLAVVAEAAAYMPVELRDLLPLDAGPEPYAEGVGYVLVEAQAEAAVLGPYEVRVVRVGGIGHIRPPLPVPVIKPVIAFFVKWFELQVEFRH